MKKLSTVLSIIAFLFISILSTAKPADNLDYFVGKWQIVIKGTPNGDAQMVFILSKKDGEIAGVIQDTSGTEISVISKSEIKEGAITLYFTAQGYDVNLDLKKITNKTIESLTKTLTEHPGHCQVKVSLMDEEEKVAVEMASVTLKIAPENQLIAELERIVGLKYKLQ